MIFTPSHPLEDFSYIFFSTTPPYDIFAIQKHIYIYFFCNKGRTRQRQNRHDLRMRTCIGYVARSSPSLIPLTPFAVKTRDLFCATGIFMREHVVEYQIMSRFHFTRRLLQNPVIRNNFSCDICYSKQEYGLKIEF